MQTTTYPGDELQEWGNTRLPQEAQALLPMGKGL